MRTSTIRRTSAMTVMVLMLGVPVAAMADTTTGVETQAVQQASVTSQTDNWLGLTGWNASQVNANDMSGVWSNDQMNSGTGGTFEAQGNANTQTSLSLGLQASGQNSDVANDWQSGWDSGFMGLGLGSIVNLSSHDTANLWANASTSAAANASGSAAEGASSQSSASGTTSTQSNASVTAGLGISLGLSLG